MARSEVSAQELMRIVIDEVDQARDIYQLAEQLAGHLPIRSMDELVKALDGKQLRFRDTNFDVDSLASHIPSIAFPVDDPRGLVERIAHIVRMVPPAMGVDLESPDGIRRQLRHSSLLASNLGVIQNNNVAASAIVPGMTPPDLSSGSPSPERSGR